MSEYLKNLQETVMLSESFNRVREETVVTEEELREELQDMFEADEIEPLIDGAQWLTQAQQTGMTASGALAGAVAVGVAALAVAAYKKHFSQAAKACGGQSGTAKTMCMNKFKEKAKQAKISTLKSGMGRCAKDKNPAKCKASLQKKIAAAGG